MARNSVGTTVVWALGLILVSGLAAATWAMLADGGADRPRRHRAPVSTASTPVSTPDAPSAGLEPVDVPVARPSPARRAPLVKQRRQPRNRLSRTMQAILADPDADEHVLIEVGKIRDSAPGQAILNCLPMHDMRELKDVKARSGFDPINQVQRFGFADNVAAIRGDFRDVDWSQFKEGLERTERDGIEIYSDGNMRFAVIDGEYMFAGQPDAFDAAVDRVINGVTDGAPVMTADASGSLPIRALMEMLPMHRQVRLPLNQMLAETGGNLDVSVDVSDAGADVRLTLGDADPMIREAIAAGLESVKGGGVEESMKDKFADVIDGMEIDRDGENLKIRAPVTMEFLEGMLGECVHGREDVDAL